MSLEEQEVARIREIKEKKLKETREEELERMLVMGEIWGSKSTLLEKRM